MKSALKSLGTSWSVLQAALLMHVSYTCCNKRGRLPRNKSHVLFSSDTPNEKQTCPTLATDSMNSIICELFEVAVMYDCTRHWSYETTARSTKCYRPWRESFLAPPLCTGTGQAAADTARSSVYPSAAGQGDRRTLNLLWQLNTKSTFGGHT